MEIVVNYWAVLIAALLSMMLGSVWYSQAGFGTVWAKLAKVKMDKEVSSKHMAWLLGGVFVATLLTAFVLAHVSYLGFKLFGGEFIWSAFSSALWLWLGLTAARMYTHDRFESRPLKLTLLNSAYELVSILLMALVIGLMGY